MGDLLLAIAGHERSARRLLRTYGLYQRWSDETTRARWDGAAQLLEWWHDLSDLDRPALDRFLSEDAAEFLRWLEAKPLARSTLRGYREGARGLLKAIHYAKHKTREGFTDPFAGAKFTPQARIPVEIHPAALAAVTRSRTRARLELLLALLEVGFTIPEVCSRRWEHLLFGGTHLEGYRRRQVRLSRRASTALEGIKPYRYVASGWDGEKLLNWTPDTARGHLNALQGR